MKIVNDNIINFSRNETEAIKTILKIMKNNCPKMEPQNKNCVRKYGSCINCWLEYFNNK